MVFRTLPFLLSLIDRGCSYYSFLFLIFRIRLECLIVLVFWGGAFLGAFCFLTNMNVFTKNACFSENVRFFMFFICLMLVSFCFHFVSWVCIVFGGRSVLGHTRLPRKYEYFFMNHHGFHNVFLFGLFLLVSVCSYFLVCFLFVFVFFDFH